LPRTITIFLCISIFGTSAFSQQQKSVILPIEIETVIKEIETKIILLDLRFTPKGAFCEVVLKFKNPQTGEWIYFDSKDVPISPTHLLMDSFQLQLQSESKDSSTEFIKPIIERNADGMFIWKCRCEDTLPPLF
jgi:hypothetical protein